MAITSIISNNCQGFMIYSQLRWRYDSPTISTQIVPEEYPKFCRDLRKYLTVDMTECISLSPKHETYVRHLYGEIPEWPMGLVDDVLVVFRHEPTFEVAAEKWNRRKTRVDYENIGYIFQAFNESYLDAVKEFVDLKLPHSICLTEGFDYPGAYRFDIPEGCDGFSWINGKRVIEDNFSVAEWLEL